MTTQYQNPYFILFEQSPQPSFIFNMGTLAILSVNKALLDLSGFTRKELLEMTVQDLLAEEDQRFLQHTEEIFPGYSAEHSYKDLGVWKLNLSNGRKQFFDIAAYPVDLDGVFALHTLVFPAEDRAHNIRLELQESRFPLASALPVIIWTMTKDGMLDFCNRSWLEFTGITYEKARNFHWSSLVHLDDLSLWENMWLKVHKERRSQIGTLRLRDANGEYLWHEVCVIPSDKSNMYIGYAEDVHERMLAEQALQQSRDQLKLILEGVGDGITALDHDGKMIYANDAAARIVGFSTAEELKNFNINEIVNWFDIFDEKGELLTIADLPNSRALRGETIIGEQLRFHSKTSGGDLWTVVSATPAFEEGKVSFVIIIVRDVTESKQAVDRLRHSEEQMRFLAETTARLSESIDYRETLQSLSKSLVPKLADWCAIDVLREDKGIDRVAIMQKQLPDLSADRIHEFYLFNPDAPHGIASVLRTGESKLYKQISADVFNDVDFKPMENYGVCSAIIVPLVYRGKIIGALTLAMVESGRFFTESDLAFVEELAGKASAAIDNAKLYSQMQEALVHRDEFLAIASHELKTPITSIKAFLEALAKCMDYPEKFDFAKNKQYMEISVKQVDRLGSIVNDLLDINRINQGKLVYDFKVVSIGPIIAEIIERMAVSFSRHKILVKLQDLDAYVRLDELRFEQILLNIISNAVKYSRPGSSIYITMKKTHGRVKISVTDQGIGISQEDQKHIFTRYYRSSNVERSKVSGLGIGLFIVKELIKAHQGELSVSSIPGIGSTFTIDLPVEDA